MATDPYPTADFSADDTYVKEKSAPVIDKAGDICFGTLLHDLKTLLDKNQMGVTELEKQFQKHGQHISANSEQIKKLTEFQQQLKAGPEILERLTMLEKSVSGNESVSVATVSAHDDVEPATASAVEHDKTISSSPSLEDRLSNLVDSLQSFSTLITPNTPRRYSRSDSMRKRSNSKRLSGISSGIGSFEYEDIQEIQEIVAAEEPIGTSTPQKEQESSRVEPNDSGCFNVNSSSQQNQPAVGAIVWAMEDFARALQTFYSPKP